MKLKEIKGLYDLLADNEILELQQKLLAYYEEVFGNDYGRVKELIDYNNKTHYGLIVNDIKCYKYEGIFDEIEDTLFNLDTYPSISIEEYEVIDDYDYNDNYILVSTEYLDDEIRTAYYKIPFADYDVKGFNKDNFGDYNITEEEYNK